MKSSGLYCPLVNWIFVDSIFAADVPNHLLENEYNFFDYSYFPTRCFSECRSHDFAATIKNMQHFVQLENLNRKK